MAHGQSRDGILSLTGTLDAQDFREVLSERCQAPMFVWVAKDFEVPGTYVWHAGR
jgi:hypothetical protein